MLCETQWCGKWYVYFPLTIQHNRHEILNFQSFISLDHPMIPPLLDSFPFMKSKQIFTLTFTFGSLLLISNHFSLLLPAGAEDGTVTLFSSKDNTLIHHVTPGPSEPVNCVTFNPRFDHNNLLFRILLNLLTVSLSTPGSITIIYFSEYF